MEDGDSRKRMGGKNRPATRDRERLALQLRRGGMVYGEIARRLGFRSASGAYKAVSRACRSIVAEEVELLRRLECQRLDAIHEALWSRALSGDLAAIDAVVKVMGRRAKLLGLDLPPGLLADLVVDPGKLADDSAKRLSLSKADRDALEHDLVDYLRRGRVPDLTEEE